MSFKASSQEAKAPLEVNEKLTRHLADLARLELSELEVKELTQHLSVILEYFEQLQEVDLQGVKPMSHPLEAPVQQDGGQECLLKDALRADEVKPFEGSVLESASDVLYGAYKVPSIL